MKTTMFKSAILLATVFFMSSCDKESLVPISEVSQVTNQEEERANQGDVEFTHFNNETDGRTFQGGIYELNQSTSDKDIRQSDASQDDYNNETDGRTFNEGLNQASYDDGLQSDKTQESFNNETDGRTHASSNMSQQTSDQNDRQSDAKQTLQTEKDGGQFAGPPIIRDK